MVSVVEAHQTEKYMATDLFRPLCNEPHVPLKHGAKASPYFLKKFDLYLEEILKLASYEFKVQLVKRSLN